MLNITHRFRVASGATMLIACFIQLSPAKFLLPDSRNSPDVISDQESLKNAEITIDLARTAGPLTKVWTGTDIKHIGRAPDKKVLAAMDSAVRIGFNYIRLRYCITGGEMYKSKGESLNFVKFDERIQCVLERKYNGRGLEPIIVLEGVPHDMAITNRCSKKLDANQAIYPPKDDDAYSRWSDLIRSIVVHCVEKWTVDTVKKWYFEVWNEPDASGYLALCGSGLSVNNIYFKMFDSAAAGAHRALPEIQIGGPAGGDYKFHEAFLEHCHNNKIKISFISWHIYPQSDASSIRLSDLSNSLIKTKEVVKRYPEFKNLKLLITEFGILDVENHPVYDKPYNAAFQILAIREFMDAGVTLALPYSLIDPYHGVNGFAGKNEMLTTALIPSQTFRAYELLNKMNGTRLELKSSNSAVNGFTSTNLTRDTSWVVLCNMTEDYSRTFTTSITITISNLPEGKWSCKKWSIAPGICDPAAEYAHYDNSDKNNKLTPLSINKLLLASRLVSEDVLFHEGRISFQMPGGSLSFFELSIK